MKLSDGVTKEMLLQVVECFFNDLRREGKEAEIRTLNDADDVYSKDVYLVYKQVDEMLTARLSTLIE